MNDQPTGTKRTRVRKIGSIVSQLMARRGYAQSAATNQLHAIVSSSVGSDLAAGLRIGKLNQGVLQIFAPDSVTLQELNFRKRTILRKLQSAMPDSNITDLRFRIQSN